MSDVTTATDDLLGWTWVEPRDGVEAEETGGRDAPAQEPAGEDGAEQQQEQGPSAARQHAEEIVAAETSDDIPEPGSPESEKLANSVLEQPFLTRSDSVEHAPGEAPAEAFDAAPPKTPTREAREAAAAQLDDSQHSDHHDASGHWRFDRNRMRAVSRLSGEGALEGFQDPTDLPFADTPTGHGSGQVEEALDEACVDASGGSVILGWDGLWSALWQDLAAQWEGMCNGGRAAAHMVLARLQSGSVSAAEWVAGVQAKARKALGCSCPLWVALSVSSVATMAVAALAAQLWRNRELTAQLRHSDKELARLVVKVLQLNDRLQHAARSMPIVRQTSFAPGDRFTTTTVTFGVV